MPKMTKGDAYVILGLQESANEAEVKSSFKKLALRTHPDKNPNDPDATKNFHRISEAYKRITDPSSFQDEDHEGADVSEEDLANTFSAMFHEMFRNGGNHDASGMFFFGSDDDEDSEGRQDEMDMMRAMEMMMNNGMYDEEDDDNEEEYDEEDDENFGCNSDDDEDTKAAVYNLIASMTAGHNGGLAALFAGGGKKLSRAAGVIVESDSDDGDYGQDSGLDDEDSDDEDDDSDEDALFRLEPKDGWDNNKMMQTVLKQKLVEQQAAAEKAGGKAGFTAKEIAEGSFREVSTDGKTVTMEFVPKKPGTSVIRPAVADSDDDDWETTSEGDEEETEDEEEKVQQKVASKKASTNTSATTASTSVKKGAGTGTGPVESAADSGPIPVKIPQSAAPSTAIPAPLPAPAVAVVKPAVSVSQKTESSTKCVDIKKDSVENDKNVLKPTDGEDFSIGDRVCVNSKYVLAVFEPTLCHLSPSLLSLLLSPLSAIR